MRTDENSSAYSLLRSEQETNDLLNGGPQPPCVAQRARSGHISPHIAPPDVGKKREKVDLGPICRSAQKRTKTCKTNERIAG
jgi:hypothetical protein